MITDLYDPAKYVATEMFELPQVGDHMWAIFDQTSEMLLESDDAEFAAQVTQNAAFQEALRAQWLSGDTEDEYYFKTFSKLSFPHFKNKPLLHHLCEDRVVSCSFNILHFAVLCRDGKLPFFGIPFVE